MRNSFTYYGFNKKILLNILLNISKDIDYISVLVSNYNKTKLSLPKDYINYDIIAGIGCIDLINSNSQKVTLDYSDSNIILINFWATWCAPCRKEMPSLNRLQLNKNLKKIKVIPINVGGDTVEKSKEFFEDLNINNLGIFFDFNGKLIKKFSIRGLPTTILINKNGYEFARIIGYIDFENKDLLDWLINQI